MKKIGLLITIVFISLMAFAQEDGSTMEQPKRAPLETSWKQENLGEFSEPVPLAYQRENDVMYYITIWRVIDLREKMNHPLYFPTTPKGTWRSLAQVIFDAVGGKDMEKVGEPDMLPVYDEETCVEPKVESAIRASLSEVRENPVYDVETGEEIGTSSYDEQYSADQILSYRIREIWYFDKQRSALKTVILDISPMIEKVKDNIVGDAPEAMDDDMDNVGASITLGRLGYIMYDELRPYLAKQSVFNVRNSAQKMSLDDLLTHKRMFASQVIAKENVYSNRTIQDYITNPRDQVLESDKIREEIRVKEHDLWEF